jgi:SAM-dependent methyltransferase
MRVLDRSKIAARLGGSKYLSVLASIYAFAPSAVLIRTAEAELLSALDMKPPVLDLCCGDGMLCSLICPGGVEAGCDISLPALISAHIRGQYRIVVRADVARGIPFKDGSFYTVVSNSSLEHVENIDVALHEIARVLKPGGKLYVTFASNYAYEWWPCGKSALKRYLSFQPVYNNFTLEEWERRMSAVGLHIEDYQYYISKSATRLVTFLDYHFSRVYMTRDRTLARPLVRVMRILPSRAWAKLWQILFSAVKIPVTYEGGGILIISERPDIRWIS